MALHGVTSGSGRSRPMTDNTDTEEFIESHIERLLNWEWVHGVYCAEKHLRPCRLAERLGVETQYAQEMVQEAIHSAKEEAVGRGML
jgi:hypothetical protein